MVKPAFKPLAKRFEFPEAALAPGNREGLRSSIFEVEELTTGAERTLTVSNFAHAGAVPAELWATGTAA